MCSYVRYFPTISFYPILNMYVLIIKHQRLWTMLVGNPMMQPIETNQVSSYFWKIYKRPQTNCVSSKLCSVMENPNPIQHSSISFTMDSIATLPTKYQLLVSIMDNMHISNANGDAFVLLLSGSIPILSFFFPISRL